MRANAHHHAAHIPQRANHFLRHTQLRRSTAPEQVTGRRSYYRKIRMEGPDLRLNLTRIKTVDLTVDDQHLVPGGLQQRFRVTILERQMRVAAAEVDTAFESP